MKESSLLQSLEASASSVGGNDVFATLLDCTGKEDLSMSYRDAWMKSGAVAQCLRKKSGFEIGDCVLLIVESCLDFRINLIGCLRAGVVVVPCRLNGKSHLMNTVSAVGAKGVLCDGKNYHILGSIFSGHNIKVISSRDVDSFSGVFHVPVCDDHPALVQLSDGYTGKPKLITLTHGNVFHNLSLAFSYITRSIRNRVLPSADPMARIIYGCYMPPHSGFPLIIDCLLTFASHYHCILLPPAAFTDSPELFVEMLSSYNVNICSATYTALDLMVDNSNNLLTHGVCPQQLTVCQRPNDESQSSEILITRNTSSSPHPQRISVNLSSLLFVMCTGERCPISIVDRFGDVFDSYNLRMDWHVQVYSVAEHAAIVSYEDSPHVVTGRRSASSIRCGYVLERGNVDIRIIGIEEESTAVFNDVSAAIETLPSHHVSPRQNPRGDKLKDALPGAEGIIWVSSGSVGESVLDLSSRHFQDRAIVTDGGASYVCTGDRGYIDAGCLYLCGRSVNFLCIDGIRLDALVSVCVVATYMALKTSTNNQLFILYIRKLLII